MKTCTSLCWLLVLCLQYSCTSLFVCATHPSSPRSVSGATGSAQESVDLLVVGGKYFDVVSGKCLPNTGIAVRGQRILAVDVDPDDYVAEETLKLEPGQFLLPGLIDCHAHYNVRLIKQRREEFFVMPIVYLANGATVTFSCGEFAPDEMLSLRKRLESGEQIGPRLLNSGPYFGRARPGWRRAPSSDEIRKEVDYWAAQGVGGFKAKSIDPESLKVLVEQAHLHGLTVTGHLDSGYRGSVNPRDAVHLGIDRIEHFLGGDAMPDTRSAYASLPNITANDPAFKEVVELFVEKGVYFDATLTAYGYLGILPGKREEYGYWIEETQFFTPYFKEKYLENFTPAKGMDVYQRIYDAKLKTIHAYFAAGGKITLGTDHVSVGTHLPGFGVHRELDAFVRAGIPPADALRIGTINGARALKIAEDHGSITEGKFADFVLINGDPLENIRHTRNIVTVVKQGGIYQAKELLDSVVGKLGPANEDEESLW